MIIKTDSQSLKYKKINNQQDTNESAQMIKCKFRRIKNNYFVDWMMSSVFIWICTIFYL